MPNTQPAVLNKTIGVPLKKDSMSRTDKGTLITRGFFTSDNKDMHGDIITRAATERAIEQYRQWGNIRRMHAPNPVGKVVGIGEADGLAWNEVEIEVINPDAIFEVENGLLQALSIGAMIQWEDITWLEDGGMLVSNYLLGEISLVDHPGNYDALLSSDKSAATAIQMLVKHYGIDPVSKGMLEILKENDMAEKTDLEKDVVEDEITETPEASAEDVEAEDVETTKEIEEEVEDAVEDTESVEETDEAIEETEDVETEPEAEEETIEASIEEDGQDEDRLTAIETQLGVLTDLVRSLVDNKAEVVDETVEEEQDTAEVDGANEDAEVAEDAHKTVVPTDDETDEADEPVEARLTLHQALNMRFGIEG